MDDGLQQWQKNALLLLGSMASGAENAWTKGKAQLYLLVLNDLGAEYTTKAVQWAALNCKWRPEPAELREIAADLASKLPAVGEMWREFWHKAITDGYTEPRWRHPILTDVVQRLGGWREIRSRYWHDSEARMVDTLRSRFEKVFGELKVEWSRTVASQLKFPAAERDPKYFLEYRPFNPPRLVEHGDTVTRAPLLAPSALITGMPDDVRRQIAGKTVGKTMPALPPAPPAMSAQKRADIEAELNSVRSHMDSRKAIEAKG